MTKKHHLRPAAFLDRDGTIMVERGYLADPARVELIPGAANALARLKAAGYALIVVTNQSGIARGFYGDAEYQAVQSALEELLAEQGVTLDATYHCPHHPDFSGPCECRKPGLALFREAAETHNLDLGSSIWVGDRPSDLVPGTRFGGRAFLVRTGYGREHESNVPAGTRIVDDLAALPEAILGSLSG